MGEGHAMALTGAFCILQVADDTERQLLGGNRRKPNGCKKAHGSLACAFHDTACKGIKRQRSIEHSLADSPPEQAAQGSPSHINCPFLSPRLLRSGWRLRQGACGEPRSGRSRQPRRSQSEQAVAVVVVAREEAWGGGGGGLIILFTRSHRVRLLRRTASIQSGL